MNIPERPRITVDVTLEQYIFFQQFPNGIKKQLFVGVINMMMSMYKRLGPKSLGMIVSESFNIEEYFGGHDEH